MNLSGMRSKISLAAGGLKQKASTALTGKSVYEDSRDKVDNQKSATVKGGKFQPKVFQDGLQNFSKHRVDRTTGKGYNSFTGGILRQSMDSMVNKGSDTNHGSTLKTLCADMTKAANDISTAKMSTSDVARHETILRDLAKDMNEDLGITFGDNPPTVSVKHDSSGDLKLIITGGDKFDSLEGWTQFGSGPSSKWEDQERALDGSTNTERIQDADARRAEAREAEEGGGPCVVETHHRGSVESRITDISIK